MKAFFANLWNDLVETFWVYSAIPYYRGRRAARLDVKRGKIALRTFGRPAKWRVHYAEILQARYQVSLESITDEFIGGKLREEIRGYNSVMKELLRSRHGKDFLDMAVEQAKDALIKLEKQNPEPDSQGAAK